MKKRQFLKEARQSVYYSQAQLARELNISKSYMCAIESGDRNPSGVLAYKISKILDIDMELFFEKV